MSDLRVAVIGCGAVAQLVHLPSLEAISGMRTTLLIDTDVSRAADLARTFGVPATGTDYREAIGRVDAAIVAVPHHLHAHISTELLDGGVHVLVEKPMALHSGECDAMIAAAEAAGRVLAVGLLRRFHDSLRFTKSAIDTGLIGRLKKVEIREGAAYRWMLASDAMFKRPAGGVLADAGAHVLDLLVWWFGDCEIRSYRDDAAGGVEADCEIRVGLPDGVGAVVALSRARDLPGTALLEGHYGVLEVGTKTDSTVRLAVGDRRTVLAGKPIESGGAPPASLVDMCIRQLEDFRDAIRDGRPPRVTGREGRKSVTLIETCYAMRQPIEYPWEAPLPLSAPVVTVEA